MAFRFDKFTLKAQEAVQRAQDLAADRGNPQIDPLHLLAALLGENEGVVKPILDKIGVNRGAARSHGRSGVESLSQRIRRWSSAAEPATYQRVRGRAARSGHDEG